jgi:hypothetical protein
MSPISEIETGKAPDAEGPEPILCTGKILGGKRAGQPCTQLAVPGSDRCLFHPKSAQEVAEAQAAGDTTMSAATDRLMRKLAAQDAETVLRDDECDFTDDLPDNDDAPSAKISAEHGEASDADGGGVPDGFMRKLVLDSALNDYVEKIVPIADSRVQVRDMRQFTDAFEIGPEYRQGSAARFDYRWSSKEPHMLRMDAENGFVPQRESLDNRHEVREGAVSMGDLILQKRPKEVTAARAKEMSILQAQAEGEEFAAFEEEARRSAREEGVDDVPTFGGVSESRGAFPSENAPSEKSREAARLAPEPARPRGRASFAFPNNPLARDRDAERRGAVGG